MNNIVIDGVALTSVVGIVAFIVSAIVEVTKKIKPFSFALPDISAIALTPEFRPFGIWQGTR